MAFSELYGYPPIASKLGFSEKTSLIVLPEINREMYVHPLKNPLHIK